MPMRSLAAGLWRPCLRGYAVRPCRLLSTLPDGPIFRALRDHDPSALAVVHSASQREFTYGHLVADVLRAKRDLERNAAAGKLAGERVAFLAENSYDYVGRFLFLCY